MSKGLPSVKIKPVQTLASYVLVAILFFLIGANYAGLLPLSAFLTNLVIALSGLAVTTQTLLPILLEVRNDKRATKLKPRLRIEPQLWRLQDRHPLHLLTNDVEVLTLKVTNIGGEETANEIQSNIRWDLQLDSQSPLGWIDWERANDIRRFSNANAEFIQKEYPKKRIEKITKGGSSSIDLLFCMKGNQNGFVLDASMNQFDIGDTRDFEVIVSAEGLDPIRVQSHLKSPSWDGLKLTIKIESPISSSMSLTHLRAAALYCLSQLKP